MKRKILFNLMLIVSLFIFVSCINAQTATFVYQGKLQDGALPANGNYQFEFKLYDAAAGGNQIAQTLTDLNATVSAGIFAVNLDFGVNAFDGTARYLEISVRTGNSAQPYTPLNPRQPVTSTPYAVKSLKADEAVTAITANNSLNLGSLPASQYVQTTDPRMSDARDPLPSSSYYIQNGTGAQASSNFNISGEGKANIFNAATQFNLGGSRILSAGGGGNLFAGTNTGLNNTGTSNAFFGAFAGEKNTSGTFNSFFGRNAGFNNLTGSNNSFFGLNAGVSNTIGAQNVFAGSEAGYLNTSGNDNAFFGRAAGLNNVEGSRNTFIGFLSGTSNTNENDNTFLGYNANGAAGITNATAIGSNASVTASNTMVLGTNAVTVFAPGSVNTTSHYKIGGNRVFHLTGTDNAFIGFEAGQMITSGSSNAFFGKEAGKNTTTGFNNTFSGAYAGRDNIAGTNNSFFGNGAGLSNQGNFNSFFGGAAGLMNITGAGNSFFGNLSGFKNEGGSNNSFVGYRAGETTITGNYNTFVGSQTGAVIANGGGSNNTALGYQNKFAAGVNDSIAIGTNITVTEDNTVVIGKASSKVKLGDVYSGGVYADLLSTDFVVITGGSAVNLDNIESSMGKITTLTVGGLTVNGRVKFNDTLESNLIMAKSLYSGGTSELCYVDQNNSGTIYHVFAQCSSSVRYKDNIQSYRGGLNVLNQLRPVTFNWKSNGRADVGFVAEEVNTAEPLLSNYDENGRVEGVKYSHITTVLVNSVKEQQSQIEAQTAENQKLRDQLKQQQAQIDALKALMCAANPGAAICQPARGVK